MPIPGPGTAISMNTIATEFGGTVPHSLSEYYRGGGLVPNTPTNAAIPTSGAISMGNFYGSSSRTAVALTIAANTNSYDVYTNRGPSYVAGSSDVTVTINPGVTVGSTTTPAYAMLVPSAFSPTDTITIVNNGLIQGCGGAAGNGGAVNQVSATAGTPGAAGGSALYVNRPVVVTNNGTIASGGGGGGGGGVARAAAPKNAVSAAGSGGGGGSGSTGGAAGSAGPGAPSTLSVSGNAGSVGTSPAGGSGGPPASRTNTNFNPPLTATGGAGGTGGGRGAAGATGGAGSVSYTSPAFATTLTPGGGGGGAGNYIVGNPFVTWPVTGTRQGNVA